MTAKKKISTSLTAVAFSWPTERPYFATVVEIVDGDTIKCDIDLGLYVTLSTYKVRLIGLNAAEHNTEAGKAAKANLESVLPLGTQIVLTTIKAYKYGQEFCATVWVGEQNLNERLVTEQWAARWDGNGPAPLAPWPRTAL